MIYFDVYINIPSVQGSGHTQQVHPKCQGCRHPKLKCQGCGCGTWYWFSCRVQ